jgi:predicted permease
LEALDEEYVAHQVERRGRRGADFWYWRQVLRSIPPLMRSRRRVRPVFLRGRVAHPRQALRMDLRHLLRMLRRAPVSSLATILTLTLTLGAGASILAVVDAVLLSPPPFDDPDALATLGEVPTGQAAATPRAVDYATFVAWRERAGSMATLEAFDPTNLTLMGTGVAERVSATSVTPGLLDMLGIDPLIGRRFVADDVGQPVVIMSAGFWRSRMASDPAVLGRELILGGRSHVIVGVLPETFFFALNAGDLWLPFANVPDASEAGFPVRVLARLAPGVSPGRLTSLLDEVSLAASRPSVAAATPLASAIVGDSARTLVALAGAAVLAIVIAFTNLTVLLLLRSIDRRRELAVREAIGARPSETARQLLLEAVTLVAAGLAGGIVVAVSITPAVGRWALEFGGLASRGVTVGWRAVAIVSAGALACACVCALVPAHGSRRRHLVDVLRRGASSTSHEIALRRIFVAGEVALAFVLMMSMTLPGRSLREMLAVDPGFDADGVLKLQVSLPVSEYGDSGRAVAFYSSLQNALSQRLGPGAVAIVNEAPLTGDAGRAIVAADGTGRSAEAVIRTASHDYFDVMRIPVTAGRGFDRTDNASAPARAVITESLANRLFPEGGPVGRMIRFDGQEGMTQVIGVAGDVKHRALEEPLLSTLYLPAVQFPSASSILVVRSDRPDATVIAAVREEVARLDRNLPVYSIRSMRDVVAASPGVPARRLLTVALAAFALLALLLSTIGLFGVAAHDVARRRPELALRMVLGATPSSIAIATLAHSGAVIGTGLAVGCLLSIGAVRSLAAILPAPDTLTVIGTGAVTAVLLVLTSVSAVLPVALNAGRSDAVKTLHIG